MIFQRRSGRTCTSSGEATKSLIPTDFDSLMARPRPRKGLIDSHGRQSLEKSDPVGLLLQERFT